jgi:PAS domain S-box-containing protein
MHTLALDENSPSVSGIGIPSRPPMLVSQNNEAAAQLADLTRLHQLSIRMAATLDLQPMLDELLNAVVELEGADFGLVSLTGSDADGEFLQIGASVGFSKELISMLGRLSPGSGACGTCLQRKARVIVEDVEADPIFEPYREFARLSGFRAVHSTPLITRSGEMIGVLATQFREPCHPSERSLRLIDLYARQAVDYIENARLYRKAQEEISERKRAEEALYKSELQFQSLLEKIPAGAYTCDSEGLITYFNAHAAQVWGRAPALNNSTDRYCGSFKLYLPDGSPIPHDECWMAKALKTGEEQLGREIVIERPDGTRITGLAHASPLRDRTGRLLGAVNIIVDISERKKVEQRNAQLLEEIVRRSEQVSVLSRASQQVNSVLDVQVILRTLVSLALELTGASSGTAGLMEDGRMIFREYNAGGVLSAVNLTFEKDQRYGIPSWVMRHKTYYISNDGGSDPYLRPDLRDFYGIYNLVNVPIFDRHGELIACFEIHNKKDKRPFTESNLVALQGLAAATAIALENAWLLARIREADQRKDEFLAVLAHELRNPLAPIRNALHILQSPLAGRDLCTQARDTMERQIDHMVRLVDDLLDVSRITRGKIELRREQVELASVIRSAIETSRPQIEEYSHLLTVELSSGPVYLNADLVRLSQVFANLLNNAAKYTPPGGQIRLTVKPAGASVEVSVRDSGIGISADMLPRIFDMFAQVNSSLERAQGGLGIGLTLVKTLAEMHGGRVEVISDGLGKGSQFTVHLPVIPTMASEKAEPEAKPAGESAKGLRVLVVDDNEASAKTMGWTMELLGHGVQLAHNGPDAITLGASYKPHIVLLDIGLPGMSGYDVCEQMRRMPEFARTVFVAQTGWGQEQHRQRSKEAGFHHHLVKPVDMAMLQQLLDSLITGGQVPPG